MNEKKWSEFKNLCCGISVWEMTQFVSNAYSDIKGAKLYFYEMGSEGLMTLLSELKKTGWEILCVYRSSYRICISIIEKSNNR